MVHLSLSCQLAATGQLGQLSYSGWFPSRLVTFRHKHYNPNAPSNLLKTA